MFSSISAGFHPKVHNLLQAGGVPYLQGISETLRAIHAFEQYAAFRRRFEQTEARGGPSPAGRPEWRARLAQAKGALSEVEGRRLLADYGIRGPREQVAADAAEACRAAEQIGFPVVIKIQSPDIQHKTEAGGVKVGLKDTEAVAQAYAEMIESARRYKPDARLEGAIVQEMIPATAVEVIVGILRDPEFGPVIVSAYRGCASRGKGNCESIAFL